ncbi:uncharacterized protein LOC142608889 [Castanea sativa]|uniref:uncharacterized protein LOC142608889 n=1 Tax=Castanea sativa TaxID=21020 RepID=UPI003F649789
MFYTGGLPFNFARNLYYCSSYSYAASHSIPGYVPPGYNTLRTTLLQREKAHVDRLLKPIKDFWLENGVNIVSDGWSDPQRRPLINIMAVPDGGLVFIKAIDGSGEFKDKHYIVGVLRDAIKEIGHDKVVQVITDNANVMKPAGAFIEGNTDKPCLHLVYEMWDSMIEKVKAVIYQHEGLEDNEYSSFWSVMYDILIDRWTKNCTPLHCLAHSLNPKYYSIEWLSKNPKRISPHRDHEISMERSKCLDRYFEDVNELNVVKFEFAAFSEGMFPSPAALTDRRNEEYINRETKMWDIVGDSWNEGDIYGGK